MCKNRFHIHMHTLNGFIVPIFSCFLLLAFFLDACAAGKEPDSINVNFAQANSSFNDEGIRFSCTPSRLREISAGMANYLASLGITPNLIVKRADQVNDTLVFALNTPSNDYDTLQLKSRREFSIKDRFVRLPAKNGKFRRVATVSKKEILLALLQHGRLTEFSGENCNLRALKELVGLRQNIVAWSENLNWVWPDGESAEWNEKYWHRGTPLREIQMHEAVVDAFMNQGKYSIGCYTATKLVIVQGVLDYYRRVSNDHLRQKQIETSLLSDQEPLVNIEPGAMWSFEQDFDPALARPGKLLRIQYGVAPRNFVPGDWVYLLNNDPVSSRKIGYEGSNAIYLGRNKFADYYNDNRHSYTYRQKLNEVFQWRNSVFNRRRDSAKIQFLSDEEFRQLGKSPVAGGLVMDFRVSPAHFIY